ncbi:hypothetical protein [Treponema putidum]|uniref:hypothetical protein n=1 Tax=Treponema putidum TaxID=221027 RepID=UPI003D93E7BB
MNKAEYFTTWTKPFPRDVSAFGEVSSNNRAITFNKAFYIYGIKFAASASCKEEWRPSSNAPTGTFGTVKYPDKTLKVDLRLTLDNDKVEYTNPIYINVQGYDGFSGGYTENGIIKTGYKIKKVEVIIHGEGTTFRQENGGTIYGWIYTGYGKVWGVIGFWTWGVTTTTFVNVKKLHIYEYPYIDSGMRIAGANGKVYTPAETVFPSPLRIFHKRVRNIMLVPLGCDYASVFKIQTRGGIQAITTLS